MPKDTDEFVEAFAKGLSTIRAFSGGTPEMTLTEVARAVGVSPAGARRLLHTLCRLGYAEAVERRFRLTPRILDLGSAYLNGLPSWSHAQIQLERLAASLGETCSGAVLDGHEIIYVLRVQVQRILASGGSIGTRQPAHATSMGRVLLAWSDDKARDRALSPDLLQPRTKRTITDPDRLRDEIRVVREQGWSLVDGELEEGVAGISVPVINRAGRLVFALNVSASTARVPSAEMPTRFLPELRAVATELERTL